MVDVVPKQINDWDTLAFPSVIIYGMGKINSSFPDRKRLSSEAWLALARLSARAYSVLSTPLDRSTPVLLLVVQRESTELPPAMAAIVGASPVLHPSGQIPGVGFQLERCNSEI